MTATIAIPTLPATLPATLQRIVLLGFMGAGKTATGHALAERLNWSFLDLDAHIESRTGLSIPTLFATRGEQAFRRLESTALANALGRTRTVLALGGGTPETHANQLLLEQTPGTSTLYLEAPFETLFDRCMLQSFATPTHIRPLLQDPATARLRFDLRTPLYRRLARHTIPTATQTPEETAQSILTLLT